MASLSVTELPLNNSLAADRDRVTNVAKASRLACGLSVMPDVSDVQRVILFLDGPRDDDVRIKHL